jgi:hypothetical protein
MAFVVKVREHGHPNAQWIGNAPTGALNRPVPREEARVFPTELDAVVVIKVLERLLPYGSKFELQGESE